MTTIKEIHRTSAELRRLKDRIDVTVKTRWDSRSHQAEWERACVEFQQRGDSLYFPGGSETLGRVRRNDPDALDAAVKFLAADPYHFRSGYMKEYLWRWLQHCTLTPAHRSSLERAGLLYLERGITREFWSMCKAMARLGRPEFWSKVTAEAQVVGTPQAFRAFCMLTYGANIHAGANLRRSVHRSWISKKYGGL